MLQLIKRSTKTINNETWFVHVFGQCQYQHTKDCIETCNIVIGVGQCD